MAARAMARRVAERDTVVGDLIRVCTMRGHGRAYGHAHMDARAQGPVWGMGPRRHWKGLQSKRFETSTRHAHARTLDPSSACVCRRRALQRFFGEKKDRRSGVARRQPPLRALIVRQRAACEQRLRLGQEIRSRPPADAACAQFVNISEHADGERRGPASIWRVPKGAFSTETFPVPPSRSDLAPRRSPLACAERLLKMKPVVSSSSSCFTGTARAGRAGSRSKNCGPWNGWSGTRRVADANLFLTTVRRMPTANAERIDLIGGWHRKGLGETRL